MGETTGLLSLISDATSRRALEEFMLSRGVDAQTARLAAEQCERASLSNGATAAVAGSLLATFATAPVGGLGMGAGAVLGLFMGAGATLAFGEECRQIRDVAFDVAELGRRNAD